MKFVILHCVQKAIDGVYKRPNRITNTRLDGITNGVDKTLINNSVCYYYFMDSRQIKKK